MKNLKQYIRTILEASTEDDERSDTHKVVHLFLSEYGSMQAIELAEMLPDVNPNVVDMMQIIQSRVEEIIEYGRGNFPKEWVKDPEISRYGLSDGPYLGPLMKIIRELKQIALAEIDGPGHDEEWQATGKMAMKLGKDFQQAIWAVNLVLQGKKTPEEMMNMSRGFGKTFAELADRFGIML